MTVPPPSLLPCPFCGGEAILRGVGYRGAADCFDIRVSCSDCDADGPPSMVDQSEAPDVDQMEHEAVAEATSSWNAQPSTIRGERVLVGVLVIGAKVGLVLGFAAGFLTAAAIAWCVA